MTVQEYFGIPDGSLILSIGTRCPDNTYTAGETFALWACRVHWNGDIYLNVAIKKPETRFERLVRFLTDAPADYGSYWLTRRMCKIGWLLRDKFLMHPGIVLRGCDLDELLALSLKDRPRLPN